MAIDSFDSFPEGVAGVLRRCAKPGGLAHAPAPLRIAEQCFDCFRHPGMIAGWNGDRLDAMARHARNSRVKRCIDDRQARRHRFQLSDAKGLGIGHGRQDEDVRGTHEFGELGMGSGAEQADAVRDAEATDHSFKPRPFRTLADNPDLKTLAHGRSHQHIEALVGDELSAGEHEPSATAFGVVIVGALDRPIILRDIDAERNDVTFLSEFLQQRAAVQQNGIGHDDSVRPAQRPAHQRFHKPPQSGMRNDVRMVVHDQRSIAAQPKGEHEIGQRKWRMKREQIVIGDPAP